MGLRERENEILAELKEVCGNPKIKKKDMMEWSTSDGLTHQDGESVVHLPKIGAYVALASALVKTELS